MGATASNEKRTGSRRKNGLRDVSGEWQGFVDLPLSDADKAKLVALSGDDYPDIRAFLDDVLSDGYKVSFVRDEKHSCVISTLTGKGEGCLNAGYSLSARGPDLAGSILVLYYKHVVLCEAQRWAGHEGASNGQLSMWG